MKNKQKELSNYRQKITLLTNCWKTQMKNLKIGTQEKIYL